MYEYVVCNTFDKTRFARQCEILEENVEIIGKNDLLEDVDGSQVQIYKLQNDKKIRVENDAIFGVNIESDIQLENNLIIS